jgi:NhaP-type Na+/H+ or K+/H+ antiporter
LVALVGLVGGYALGVAAGLLLVSMGSSNTHDRSLEMAMTAAFVTGPLGAILGIVMSLVRSRRQRAEG